MTTQTSPQPASPPASQPATIDQPTGSEWWRTPSSTRSTRARSPTRDGDGIGDLPGITARLPHLRRAGRRRGLAVARSTPRRRPTPATTSPTTATSTRCSAPSPTPTRWSPGPRAGPAGDRRHRAQPHLRRARVVPGGPGRARPAARERGPLPLPRRARARTASCRRTTGSRSSAARPGPGSSSRTAARPVVPAPVRPEQPDLDWTNPEVRAEFESHPAVLARPRRRRLPDRRRPRPGQGRRPARVGPRRRAACGGLDARPPARRTGTRTACTTSTAPGAPVARRVRRRPDARGRGLGRARERLARYVRPDELHQAFNFAYLRRRGDAGACARSIDGVPARHGAVGAPATWVLSQPRRGPARHALRLARSAGAAARHRLGRRAARTPRSACAAPAPPPC